jgi:hypothetical protein
VEALIMDEQLERLDEPETLPQEIVQWQPGRGPLVNTSSEAVAAGLVGALAVGVLVIGAMALSRLAFGAQGRIRRLDVDELTVGDLKILER